MTRKRYKAKQKIRSLCRLNGRVVFALFALSSLFCKDAVSQLHVKDGCYVKYLEGTKINNAGESLVYDGRSKKFKAPIKYKVRSTKKVTLQETRTNKEAYNSPDFCFRPTPLSSKINSSANSMNSDGCVNFVQQHKLYVVTTKRININILLDCEPICEVSAILGNYTKYRSAQVTRPPPASIV
ncbi:MAG: hypothetical protein LBF79_02345 [Dysgonamonadaceae bacterium]|jgi:hypothetical protein|nr:hypothetical protein [Dysgonamonadaceae bacterium]